VLPHAECLLLPLHFRGGGWTCRPSVLLSETLSEPLSEPFRESVGTFREAGLSPLDNSEDLEDWEPLMFRGTLLSSLWFIVLRW